MLTIYAISNSRPDFIELQLKSFRKYLQEDFRFVIFNNAKMDNIAKNRQNVEPISNACERLGIPEIFIPKDAALIKKCQALEINHFLFNEDGTYTSGNVANAYALCWAWNNFISKANGPILLLDTDVFLVEPVKLTDYLKDHDLGFISQSRTGGIEYIWNAFFLADTQRLPGAETMNWYCGMIDGTPVDVSGQTHHYLKSYPSLRRLQIRPNHTSDDPSTDFHPSNYEEFWTGDKRLALHYRSGSNWDHKSDEYHQKKTAWLKRTINV